ncbi:MAG TPA: fasciclin domain-containing protein [Acidimicrobiia bacterium]
MTENGANVLQTDIGTSNGIIHVIDAVLLPPSS